MSEIIEPEDIIAEHFPDRPNNYRDLLQQTMAAVEQYPKFGEILFLKLKTKYGVYKP